MPSEEEKSVLLRQEMIRQQLRCRRIHDERVLDAFAAIPRERFVPPHLRKQAYSDGPLPIGSGQTISQPYVVALMLQELQVGPEHRVLDVGAGSGYQTALLGKLAGEVVAIERIAELAERARQAVENLPDLNNIDIVCGDGSLGLPDRAPFDRIICGAAAPSVPTSWIEQLAEGGRIVTPVGGHFTQTICITEKHEGKVTQHRSIDVRFVPLIGKEGWSQEG